MPITNLPNLNADRLYLDLLKRSITNNIHSVEPDVSRKDNVSFWDNFLKHYIQSPAISMLPLVRLDNIEYCIRSVIDENIPGDFIETGVWRGGAVIFMSGVLKVLGRHDRVVWAADSFEGLPEPDAQKFPLEAKAFRGPVINKAMGRLVASLEDVQANYAAYGLLDDQVDFLKGWFKDSLPAAPIERLSIMRLDGDFYESTCDALTSLYDKLSPGGYCIIDDYGEDSWTYCRQAVDEFRAARGVTAAMIQVDAGCWYWRKD